LTSVIPFFFLHDVSTVEVKYEKYGGTFKLKNSGVRTRRQWHYKEEVLHKAKHAPTIPQKKTFEIFMAVFVHTVVFLVAMTCSQPETGGNMHLSNSGTHLVNYVITQETTSNRFGANKHNCLIGILYNKITY
jgi:hypothetical protein